MAVIFYARLNIILAIAMAVLTLMMAWLIFILPNGIGLFIAAWVRQFYGHKVERKKPSFFKDLQFLLIGPIWCLDTYLGKVSSKWKTYQKTQMKRI